MPVRYAACVVTAAKEAELVGANRPNRSRSRVVGRVLGLGAMGAALVAVLSGCVRTVGEVFGGFGWPEVGISDQSAQMYDLWVGAVITALVVGGLVWGLIFWCIIRYRKRGDELPAQTRFNLPMEVLYTLTPFLVIAVLFYYTVTVQTDADYLSPDPDVTVEVTAFKWNWQFGYQRDGETVASTTGTTEEIPVLVVPTGQTVQFLLHSNDVIHAFWVPELLFKRDVFPGPQLQTRFEITIPEGNQGAYVGRCAELCGIYHSMMNFEMRVVSPQDYAAYVAALEDGLSQADALLSIGQEPYAITTEPFTQRLAQG